jgi:hypothetical protein
MTHAHRNFISTIEDYFNEVSLDPKMNNETFAERMEKFIHSPTTSNFQNLLLVSTSVNRDTRDLLEADNLSTHFNERYNGDFLPLNEITKSMEPANKGEVIMWCDEYYIVGDVHGDSAEVLNMDGSLESNNFKFGYENEPHYVFGIKADMVEDTTKYDLYDTPETQPDILSRELEAIIEKHGVKDKLGIKDTPKRRPKMR